MAEKKDSPTRRSVIARIGGALFLVLCLGWGLWRWFLVAGGPWKAGHSCSNLVACRDGLCLVHARPATGQPLATVAGYCSRRCQQESECPAGMACEPLPKEISRHNGDHLPLIQLPERLCVRVSGGR